MGSVGRSAEGRSHACEEGLGKMDDGPGPGPRLWLRPRGQEAQLSTCIPYLHLGTSVISKYLMPCHPARRNFCTLLLPCSNQRSSSPQNLCTSRNPDVRNQVRSTSTSYIDRSLGNSLDCGACPAGLGQSLLILASAFVLHQRSSQILVAVMRPFKSSPDKLDGAQTAAGYF